ncbi:MAG: CPBP family intramembrane metalloprotease [Chitinophagaceae bacterium]|jgi:membrane protease YdiL (CAAX protease family)|nr:CPBP family intramembrane metalloprotease [Chitinophagaceae bacterium]MCA6478131.1 CPBP family intramembrane metalloprotease [Chitinophagaceae bacterium]MCA6492633.1 CPBP family intramembrane metalloprotease [Chitinophagaceae bacterium]MCA6497781.1 CPBP family intramembrane metalloprotease [Chitinophagaceae bacterium]MCA6513824.1 CPBP family intramembrane metalloprotease [Chitinophagaceae bacterium]
MSNNFLENANVGTNKWWQYITSILSAILAIIIVNIAIRLVLPTIKSFFPANDFGKGLITYLLIFIVFGVALITFLYSASKIHKRSGITFISSFNKFSWSQYFLGLITWGAILFISLLISDYQKFEAFKNNFQPEYFTISLLVGFFAIGVQSFFEELIFRGYILQGLHTRLQNTTALIFVNGLLFGLLHIGYGLESFLSSWIFGVAFALIVIFQKRIEFVAGAHNANNLLLSLVFLDLSEAMNENFSWKINWIDFTIQIVALILLVGIVHTFSKKKAQ